MSDIREIVTKAVVGKGKKIIQLKEVVSPKIKPEAILGCWILNHKFSAEKNRVVEIDGSFEINIWYAYDNNSQTDVSKHTVSYQESTRIRKTVRDYSESENDVVVKVLRQPTCNNAKIKDGEVVLDISLEVLAEVIGETKMRVSILSPVETYDEEIENEDMDIDENFIKESKRRGTSRF